MSIWFSDPQEMMANIFTEKNITQHLGIEITEAGDDFLKGTMPVDERTVQPYGILHGGASVVLAETLGSVAATMTVDPAQSICVGLEVNANHLRMVTSGIVTGTATPVHLGRKTQVWSIEIVNEAGKKVCISRLTMAVVPNPRNNA